MNKIFQRKIVNIFLPIILAYVLGAQKNRLIETVLLSTHNICFGWEIKLVFRYALLTKVLQTQKTFVLTRLSSNERKAKSLPVLSLFCKETIALEIRCLTSLLFLHENISCAAHSDAPNE